MDNRTIDEVRRNEDRLINEIELLEKENRSLKKQLEEKENQQKEFIDYLENKIQSCELTCDLKEQLKQKEDIINKSKEHLELKVIRYSNETDYMLDETDLKEIIEILDNKGE